MKYQRLTEREAPLVMTLWEATKVYNRLIELENKIESGELVDRDEYIDLLMAAKDISGMTDKELEFFAKHNAKVRENADAEIVRLTAENAELRASLGKAVELPFFQKDGEVIVLIYKDKDGIVLIEKYIEDEYYNGKKGKEAAEARLKEIKEENV